MTKEERIIRNMRRRWVGITGATVLLLMFSTALFFVNHQSIKNAALVTPERVAAMASFDNPKEELPELFCRFHTLAGFSAKLIMDRMYYAILVGLALAFLIIQIADLTKRRVILAMWDRIQKLEHQVEELKQQEKSQGSREGT